jgi:hypothetical protein
MKYEGVGSLGRFLGRGEFVFPIESFEGGNGKGFDQSPAL